MTPELDLDVVRCAPSAPNLGLRRQVTYTKLPFLATVDKKSSTSYCCPVAFWVCLMQSCVCILSRGPDMTIAQFKLKIDFLLLALIT